MMKRRKRIVKTITIKIRRGMGINWIPPSATAITKLRKTPNLLLSVSIFSPTIIIINSKNLVRSLAKIKMEELKKCSCTID